MSEDNESIAAERQSVEPLSHRRILILMAATAISSGIFGFLLISWQFGAGVLLGGILSLINYYWLKFSLKKIFEQVVRQERPQFLAVRYTFRYLVLGGILLVIFLTKSVPILAVILGLASFALAITIEGFIRIFSSFFNKKEI